MDDVEKRILYDMLFTLMDIKKSLIKIEGHLTRSAEEEFDEKVHASEMWQMREKILADLAKEQIRDGVMSIKKLYAASDVLNKEPDEVEKMVFDYMMRVQRKKIRSEI